MHGYFGFVGTELEWFRSYLTNREQQCTIKGQISSTKKIVCGIPQDSILGPLLFLLYINDMPESKKKKDKIYRLTWEKHIDKICAKVGAGIGVTRRMRPFVPLETLKLIYNALVQPYFDYCSPLWDNCGGGLKDKLQRVQNRAVRVITGSTFDIRSDDVQIMLGIRRPEIY